MNRRRFIGCGLAGMGLASVPSLAGDRVFAAGRTDQDTHTRVAMFYKAASGGAKCGLCPNNCLVSEIRPGDCHTRIYRQGRLLTQTYGNPFYVNSEKPEDRSLFHFLPGSDMLAIGTAGCNLQCLNCNVSGVSQKSPSEVPHKELFPADGIAAAGKNRARVIAFTYSEPVVFYEYMLDTAMLARQQGIKTLMTSNGYIQAEPLKRLIPFLDAAVIDLKAFNENTYMRLTGGSIKPVFETINLLHDNHIWLELSHLLVPGWTTDQNLYENMGKWMVDHGFRETPFHINRFIPSYRLTQLNATKYDDMARVREVLLKTGVSHVYAQIATDKSASTTTCPQCHAPVIIRNPSLVMPQKPGICNTCGYKIAGIWN
jgi:pyruvate formate lyase activating enzyme